jgi:hypothetical protein
MTDSAVHADNLRVGRHSRLGVSYVLLHAAVGISPAALCSKVGLAAGVPRILPLVQFCQIRQAVYRQLLIIALASNERL